MKIKTKMILTTGITIIVIALVFIIIYYYFTDYNRKVNINNDVGKTANLFVENVAHYTTFWDDHNMHHIQIIQNNVSKMYDLLDNDINNSKGELKTTINHLKKAYILLTEKAQEYVMLINKFGLTENDGLRKKFRDSIHTVENEIKKTGNYKLLSDLLMLRRREKNFIIRNDEKYIEKWNNDFTITLNDVKKANLKNSTKARILNALNDYKNYFSEFQKSYKAIKNIEANFLSLVNNSTKDINSTQTYLDKISLKTKSIITILLVISFIVIIAIIFLFVILPVVGFINPIFDIVKHTQRIEKGDFSVYKTSHRTDEIGKLTSAIEKLTKNLRVLINNIKSSSSDLHKISIIVENKVKQTDDIVKEINKNTDKIKKLIIDQSSSVEETSAAIEQMTRNIESLNQSISDQAASVNESSAAIEQMVSNIQQVTRTVENANNSVSQLTDASEKGNKKIDELNKLIADVETQSELLIEANNLIANISEKTNLLAMNAAIEAAHAGDAGRGFAVVADEIRKLAEQSSLQSKEIEKNLQKIKESIENVVVSSKETKDSFNIIEQLIDVVKRVMEEIKQSMVEQSEGSNQILEALKKMNEITASVKTGASEMQAGNSQIIEAIKNLNKITKDTNNATVTIINGIENVNRSLKEIDKAAELNKKDADLLDDLLKQFTVSEELKENTKKLKKINHNNNFKEVLKGNVNSDTDINTNNPDSNEKGIIPKE